MTMEPTHGSPVGGRHLLRATERELGTLLRSRAMAKKPRVQAPKQRSGAASPDDRRTQRIVAAVGLAVLASLLLPGALFTVAGAAAFAAWITAAER